MKSELIKFMKWWNANRSQLSVRITVGDIDSYINPVKEKNTCKTDSPCGVSSIGSWCATCEHTGCALFQKTMPKTKSGI